MATGSTHASPAVVLPVGGGKGGIGKSAVTANLALVLARLEHRVVCVDADLGGSDLHNLLGLGNDLQGLGEVLAGRDISIHHVVHEVLEPGLSFVPGDAMMVATANPVFQKKRKLLDDIRKLTTQFVLLDLGAGASITVMDFFLIGPLSLLIMLPERPAVLNAFNFLKNTMFRSLERLFRGNSLTGKVLAEFRVRSRGPGAMRLVDLVLALEKARSGAGEKARRALRLWRPKLILNRVRRMDDFVYARQLERWASEDLGLQIEVMGFLPEDDVLLEASVAGRPALDLNPKAPFCKAITLVGLKMSPWAGRAAEWAGFGGFQDSFERAATEFAPFFPPPGEPVPTRAELMRRLRELERGFRN